MSKYIDSEKLIAEIDDRLHCNGAYDEVGDSSWHYDQGMVDAYKHLREVVTSLQQEQPIEGKQVIIITETDGDSDIHWDCRSLDDVIALLTSARSFIADKQIEELRGQGSGPDYNTTEGRFRNVHKFQQEQPEVDLEKEIEMYISSKGLRDYAFLVPSIARHFYELGLRARKEESK